MRLIHLRVDRSDHVRPKAPMALPGQLPDARVGDVFKVFLPGESPWAECVAVHDDGTWEGKILNKLISEYSEGEVKQFVADSFGRADTLPKLHDFKQDQVVRFRREVTPEWEIYVPADFHNGTA